MNATKSRSVHSRIIRFVHRKGIARTVNSGGGPFGRHAALVEVIAPMRRAAGSLAAWRIRHDGLVIIPAWDSIRVDRVARHSRFRWRVWLSYERATR